ncbi:unnamed protein product, partial [Iphiclides podalirius]
MGACREALTAARWWITAVISRRVPAAAAFACANSDESQPDRLADVPSGRRTPSVPRRSDKTNVAYARCSIVRMSTCTRHDGLSPKLEGHVKLPRLSVGDVA